MRTAILFTIAMLFAFAAVAEDGALFIRDISKTPEDETDGATMKMLGLYVPAQTSGGELLAEGVTYPLSEDSELTPLENRLYARPLVAFYHDGPDMEHAKSGGVGIAHADVFGAVSLDDGQTWKRSNLSNSGFLSSFRLHDGTDYPGGTFRLFAAADGNKVLVAWASRYARGGNPNYAMTDEDKAALATYLGLEVDDLYLNDMWGVSGSQRSSDFADEGYPEVGEVPYAALWTARGTLEYNEEDGIYEMAWRKAERLTSAVRDVHRIECAAVKGAGFVITWQEDPEGLRPGDGEGPGEGWSGAVAHHQTDIWYSYISWENFDLVLGDTEDYASPIPLADYTGDGAPAVGVPFSIPVRLTDNAMGHAMPIDYDPVEDPYYLYELDEDANGTADLCAETVTVYMEMPGEYAELCIAEDGRLMRGNIAATRARVNLRGYDMDGDGLDDSAWVILAYEESKGLGEEDDLDEYQLIEKVDMGKNIWYHTFDMFEPELVSQGLMLNMPAVYPDGYPDASLERMVEYPITVDGKYEYRFMDIDPDPIYEDQAGLESTLFQAEIARRFSLISQPARSAGPSGTVAFAMWKQGIIRQGGPADVMARRFVLPEDFDPATDNPYAYENMECGTWLFDDGSNPRYVKGLCVSPPQSMSATSLVEDGVMGDASSLGNVPVDELIAAFPWNLGFDDLDMSEASMEKIYEWTQTGPAYGTDPSTLDPAETNFDDQSWENPYDLAKGHRGFISGDHIMVLYCWCPNWLANTVGHDNYNLYVRRSFDGGKTWTTAPADFTDVTDLPEGVEVTADGTEFYEWMGPAGGESEYKIYHTLGSGDFEPARNLSLLKGTQLTVLDPRYAPTALSIVEDTEDIFPDPAYPDDLRDPSKYFITFEVGDNTTVEFGEATPLDMYYSRAFNYGDDYEMVLDEEADPETDNEYYFDWLENKRQYHAAEATLMANPGGWFFYSIWNQWQEDALEHVFDSDAMVRRLMFLDENEDTDPSGGGGGNDTPPGPGGGGGGRPSKHPTPALPLGR